MCLGSVILIMQRKSDNPFLAFVFKHFGSYSVYVLAIFTGILIGVFILLPINEIIYFYELHAQDVTLRHYIYNLLYRISTGDFTVKTFFFLFVGAGLGILTLILSKSLHKRTVKIRRLSGELEKNFPVLISQGENALTEFKSSFRWDLKENKLNRHLENVVIKTLAGFMNADGGTLLIGVADNGTVVGLENDYQTLKKKDKDGFEQAVMNTISAKLGTNICRQAILVFHEVENKEICRVIVMPSHRPVFVKDGANPKLYLRIGVSTRELNIQEALDYITLRWSGKKKNIFSF
jgi:hypothetical protein